MDTSSSYFCTGKETALMIKRSGGHSQPENILSLWDYEVKKFFILSFVVSLSKDEHEYLFACGGTLEL